ncbi:MAG: PepSY domain-containing protein [Bryobacterales bacterium]|nr:PepSY domain-containing protein [Bryobacterales bacterium]
MTAMFLWIKKLHMYAGLLTFTAFVVWGVTGIHAVFLPSPDGWREPVPTSFRELEWKAPGNLDDKALCEAALAASGLRTVGAPQLRRRNAEMNLSFTVFGPNGRRDLTYLEAEGKLRVEIRQNNILGFIAESHAGSSRRGPGELASRIWGYYNELANWAFLMMTLSGIYLWLATRPRVVWAWATLGISGMVFAALWWGTR